MTFVTPVFLLAGVGVASAIVLLHFLARRRPRPAVLPTARFVPDRPARWPSRAPRPTDWLLLALRVFAILAIASAFAGPVRQPARSITTRIVLTDRSRAVAHESPMRDSVLSILRAGDVLVPFDTSVRVISTNARDSLLVLNRSESPASLSAALIAAERVAATLRDRADSVELIIVSAFASESWDDATPTLRARWPGRARLVRLPLASGNSAAPEIHIRAPRSDPVSAAAAPFSSGSEANVRIVRGAPSADDLAWTGASGRVLVIWPEAGPADSLTAEAVVSNDDILVAPLVRRSLDTSSGRVLARFADGAAALVERARGDGCTREVAFDFSSRGDVPLRESARRFMAIAAAPCEGRGAPPGLSDARLDSLRGAGQLLATSAARRVARVHSPATSWLLIAGAVLLLVELAMRRRVVSA